MAKSQKLQALEAHILKLSVATNFNSAKLEWELNGIEFRTNWHNCPCSQPIKELCHLKNTQNSATTYVGNVCVKKFLGIQTGNLFTGLIRINKDNTATMNKDLRDYALKKGIITQENYNFLQNIGGKRNLTPGQLKYKVGLNKKVIKDLII